ncbi:MAG TPA: flagellar hook-length control protein FliK [Acetobacteraceae bacterium]|nr:flagellar hook-length control protein FliK [Acetobacteraceae bacterium]
MPQAIAILPLATAAVTSAVAMALASGGSVAGKAPLFAGLLSQIGCNASPPVPAARSLAVASETSPPTHARQPDAQVAARLSSPLLEAPSAPSASARVLTGKTGVPEHGRRQSVRHDTPSVVPADQVTPAISPADRVVPAISPADQVAPAPQPAAAAVPRSASLLAIPASRPPVRQRSAAAAHPGMSRRPAAAATANRPDGSVLAAGMTPTVAPVPAMPAPAPASVPDPPRPRSAPADRQAGAARLDAVAAKPAPTASGPLQSGTAPEHVDITATAPTVQASPAWPAAAATATAGVASVQPALAAIRPEQSAGPVQLADRGAAASAAQPAAAAAAPVHQVSAALVSLARAPDGGQRMTLRLEPATLGQVQIRIDRPQDAPARVEIVVQRPETLTLLLRDQPQLQRALDQAGVPADGRSLSLHVAPPESGVSPGSASSGAAAGSDPGQGGGNGGGTRSGGQGQPGGAAEPEPDDPSAPLTRWLRAGLDITA